MRRALGRRAAQSPSRHDHSAPGRRRPFHRSRPSCCPAAVLRHTRSPTAHSAHGEHSQPEPRACNLRARSACQHGMRRSNQGPVGRVHAKLRRCGERVRRALRRAWPSPPSTHCHKSVTATAQTQSRTQCACWKNVYIEAQFSSRRCLVSTYISPLDRPPPARIEGKRRPPRYWGRNGKCRLSAKGYPSKENRQNRYRSGEGYQGKKKGKIAWLPARTRHGEIDP